MYKSILLPIDIADAGEPAKAAGVAKTVAVAKTMCEAFGAELHLLTVLPDVRRGMVAQYFPDNYEEGIARKAAEDLSEFAAREFPGISVVEHIVAGKIYRQIIETAEKQGCDLVVMASHRPELADILISPTADHVARHSPTSVMVIRP